MTEGDSNLTRDVGLEGLRDLGTGLSALLRGSRDALAARLTDASIAEVVADVIAVLAECSGEVMTMAKLEAKGFDLQRFVDLIGIIQRRFEDDLIRFAEPEGVCAVLNLEDVLGPDLNALVVDFSGQLISSVACGFEAKADRTAFVVAKLEDMLHDQKFLSLLFVLRRLGLFENGDLQLCDICSSEGWSSFIAALGRQKLGVKGRLSASLYDVEDSYSGTVAMLAKRVSSPSAVFKFNRCDATRAPIFCRQGVPNVWLIRYPEEASRLLLDRVAGLSAADMPDAIAFMPCTCHSYKPGMYPGDYDRCLISRDEWDNLSALIMSVMDKLAEPDLKSLLNASRLLMDAERARDLNARNPHLVAKVTPLAFSRRFDTYIDIRRRA